MKNLEVYDQHIRRYQQQVDEAEEALRHLDTISAPVADEAELNGKVEGIRSTRRPSASTSRR